MPQPIKNLSLEELESLLKHIRLGKEHLQKCIGREGIHQLLQLRVLKKTQKENIKADIQEKLGNVALVLNPIITGLLGSWLGFESYMKFGLQSGFALFLLVCTVLLIAGWVGLISYKLTVKKARDISQTKKLRLLELYLHKKIIKLHQKKLEILGAKILTLLMNCKPELKWDKEKQQHLMACLSSKYRDQKETAHSTYTYFLMEPLLNLWECRKKNIQDAALVYKLEQELEKLRNLYEQLDEKKCTHKRANTKSKTNFADFTLNRSLSNANSYIKILSTPGLESDYVIPSPRHWLKNNIVRIMIGLIPTLLGSLGSMFVFLTGIPRMFNILHIEFNFMRQQRLFIQIAGIGLASLCTLYYCYSYLYSNYKSFLRDKEIEKTEQVLALKFAFLARLRRRYELLVEINATLEPLLFVLTILEYRENQ